MSGWVSGWNGGLCGPTTKAVDGCTVGESLSYADWKARGFKGDKPKCMSWPVAQGQETVALAIGNTEEEAKSRSHIIAAAPELLEALNSIANELHGLLSLHDIVLRQEAGHTNVAVLWNRLELAKAAIAKAEGR